MDAENFLDIFKRGMLKLKEEETITMALSIFLQCYRTTPNAHLSKSITPSEAMMGRKIKIPLDLLMPNKQSTLFLRNSKMEEQFNDRHGAKKKLRIK